MNIANTKVMRISAKNLNISEMDVEEVRSSILIREIMFEQNNYESSIIPDHYAFLDDDYKTNEEKFYKNTYNNTINKELWAESFCNSSCSSGRMRKRLFCPVAKNQTIDQSSYSSIYNIDTELAEKTLQSINLLTIPNTHQNSAEKCSNSNYLKESNTSTVKNYMNFDDESSVIRSIEGSIEEKNFSSVDPSDWSPHICLKKKEEDQFNMKSDLSDSKSKIEKSLIEDRTYNIIINQNNNFDCEAIQKKNYSNKKKSKILNTQNDSNYKCTPKKIKNTLFDSASKSNGFSARYRHKYSDSDFQSVTPKKRKTKALKNISVINEYDSNFGYHKPQNTYKSVSFQSQQKSIKKTGRCNKSPAYGDNLKNALSETKSTDYLKNQLKEESSLLIKTYHKDDKKYSSLSECKDIKKTLNFEKPKLLSNCIKTYKPSDKKKSVTPENSALNLTSKRKNTINNNKKSTLELKKLTNILDKNKEKDKNVDIGQTYKKIQQKIPYIKRNLSINFENQRLNDKNHEKENICSNTHNLILKKIEEIKELQPSTNYKTEKISNVMSALNEFELNVLFKEEILTHNSQNIKKFSDLNECMKVKPTILSETCKNAPSYFDLKGENYYTKNSKNYDYIEVINETSKEDKENNKYFNNNSGQNSESKMSRQLKNVSTLSNNKFKCKFTSEKVLSNKAINQSSMASMKNLAKNSQNYYNKNCFSGILSGSGLFVNEKKQKSAVKSVYRTVEGKNDSYSLKKIVKEMKDEPSNFF